MPTPPLPHVDLPAPAAVRSAERVELVRARFAAADREAAAMSERTGLACPPGCGACCSSPHVETTVLEMLPAATALAREGRAAALLEELARPGRADGPCVLYAPEPGDPARGRCSAYAHRPLVCRLFGFSARRDKGARPELVACRTMRAADPETVERAARDVRTGGAAPVLADHALAVAGLQPREGARQVPIGRALRDALEHVLLEERLAALAADRGEDDAPDDGRPTPSFPRAA